MIQHKAAAFVVGAAVLMMTALSASAEPNIDEYKALMPEAAFNQTVENSERYADYFLGFCFEKIRGTPLRAHETNYKEWTALGATQTTKNLQLFNPQVSPDTFTILDLHTSNDSCWTQHDTISAPLSMQPVLDVLLGLPEGFVSILDQKSGDGFEQRTYLYNPGDTRSPVIVYFHVNYAGSINQIVGIVKKATITKKND